MKIVKNVHEEDDWLCAVPNVFLINIPSRS